MASCLSEYVVEARCPKFEVLDDDALGIERSHNIGDIACALGEANTECAFCGWSCFAESSEYFSCRFNMVVGHRDKQSWGTNIGFESLGTTFPNNLSVIDNGNAISELVSFF